jgi:PleD family two-component response regulator
MAAVSQVCGSEWPCMEGLSRPGRHLTAAIESGRHSGSPRSQSDRVLIVDDQRIARAGLHSMLDGYPDIEVVGEAEHGLAGIKMVREHHPDVV